MTEPTKEQINNNVESIWRKDFYSTNWKQIQGDSLYLEKVDFYIEARRKAQMEHEKEIKTLKEQLAEAVKLAKLGVYSVEGLINYNHESWEMSTESWLFKTKIFLEKQDKENKDEK